MKSMWIALLQLGLLLIVIGLLGYQLVSPQQNELENPEEIREFASTLRSRELYPQAIAAYQEYLGKAKLPPEKRANIHFTIAEIYRENLYDYESATAEYLRVKQLAPQGDLNLAASKNIVQSLERLKRSADAQRELDKTIRADADHSPDLDPGSVIATVGDRTVSLAELKNHYNLLPEQMQKQYEGKDGVTRLVREYVAQDLMLNGAKRSGYEQDSKVRETLAQVEKTLLIEKFYREEVQAKVQIQSGDLKLYYDAHKDQFKRKIKNPQTGAEEEVPAGFEEVAGAVEKAVRQEKEQLLYAEMIGRMLTAEKVKINEEHIPDHL